MEQREKYAVIHKKIQDLESQLHPILSLPPDPEVGPIHKIISEGMNHHCHFVNTLINTEMTSSRPSDPDHRHLADMARRVRLIQSAVRKWAPARPTNEATSASTSSCIESCVDDDVDHNDDDDDHDHDEGEGEESPVMVGFKVYENPEFDVRDDDETSVFIRHDNANDDDDDDDRVEGSAGVEEEEEILKDDDQKEERRENVGEEEGDDGIYNCCWCRVLFGVVIIGMGITFLMVGISDFSDHRPPVTFLTPT